MRPILTSSQAFFLLFTAIILIFKSADSLWTTSPDLGHHFALAFRIFEDWSLSQKMLDPVASVMSFYPRFSHILAAFLGYIFHSVLLGMHLVSLISLTLLWGSVVFILQSLPKKLAFLSSVSLVFLLIFNRYYLQLDLHSSEIIGNFFLPQLFAQALVFVAIAGAIFLEHNKKSYVLIWFFLTALLFLTLETHLVPAVELLGLLIAYLWFQWLFSFNSFKSSRLKAFAICALLSLFSLIMVVNNHSFRLMIRISGINGGFYQNHSLATPGILGLALLVFIASVGLLVLWSQLKKTTHKEYSAFKFLGLYGAAIALLCIGQIIALKFHFGSEYAIKKYLFGLYSFLVISSALFIGIALNNLFKNRALEWSKTNPISTVVAVITFIALFLCPLPAIQLYKMSYLVALEQKLQTLSYFAFPKGEKPTRTSFDLPFSINYMFSSIAHAPLDLRQNPAHKQLEYSSYLITTKSSNLYHPSCSTVWGDEIAVVDTSCLKKRISCTKDYDFSQNNRFSIGFGPSETEGRVTVSNQAHLLCVLSANLPKELNLVAAPILFGPLKAQRLKLSVKIGEETKNFSYLLTKVQTIHITLPKALPGQELLISFNIPDAVSPKQLKINDDLRELGVNIRSLNFS